jgi:putative phage-type endonuclease
MDSLVEVGFDMQEFYDYFTDDITDFCGNIPNLIASNLDLAGISITEYTAGELKTFLKSNIQDFVKMVSYHVNDFFNVIEVYDDETTKLSVIHYCITNILKLFHTKVDVEINVLRNTRIVEDLALIPLPPQRSPEWFEMRTHMLTASSLADAMGKGHFNTRSNTLLDKCFGIREEKSYGMAIMQHGVKYEDVATALYQLRYGVKVVEFGLLPHPTLKCFGASPDGIVGGLETGTTSKEHVGRMLEIKCPPKRVITDETPWHYWAQVQGQLEVTDLEDADFLQVKIEEYNSTQAFLEDNLIVDGEIQDGRTAENMEKGCVVTYRDTDSPDSLLKYIYSEYFMSNEYLTTWKDSVIDNLLTDGKDIVEFKFWKVTKWSCVLVKRNKEWFDNTATPEIIKFWRDVVYWRKKGSKELIDKEIADKKAKGVKREEDKKKREEQAEALAEAKRVEKARQKEIRDQEKKKAKEDKALEKEKAYRLKREEKEKKCLEQKLQNQDPNANTNTDKEAPKYKSPKPTESFLLDDIDKLNL